MSAEMELEDKTYLVAPPGHSTHSTQQMDQAGGPIQHQKRITGDLVCNMYRVRGKLLKARIAQCVELGIVLALTPLNCSWATEHVGWGEDSNGRLIYEPLSRPHILAEVVDDETRTVRHQYATRHRTGHRTSHPSPAVGDAHHPVCLCRCACHLPGWGS